MFEFKGCHWSKRRTLAFWLRFLFSTEIPLPKGHRDRNGVRARQAFQPCNQHINAKLLRMSKVPNVHTAHAVSLKPHTHCVLYTVQQGERFCTKEIGKSDWLIWSCKRDFFFFLLMIQIRRAFGLSAFIALLVRETWCSAKVDKLAEQCKRMLWALFFFSFRIPTFVRWNVTVAILGD